jgi:two-component sensor histidine kinase
MGRLHALATAYELLSRDQWTDIPLMDVLREELSPYMAHGQSNISLAGPAIFLRPKGALAFGMVIHELATNAVKYGGLSTPSGRVAIAWHIAGTGGQSALHWTWRESGGPAVAGRKAGGFGTALIERSLVHEMNGTATLDFLPGGLLATMAVPFDTMVLTEATSRPAPTP